MFFIGALLMPALLRFILYTSIVTTCICANEYVLVSNKSIKNLSRSQVKAIYLKKISILDARKLIPLNLGVNNPIRKSFEKHVLQMGFSRLKSYWTKQHYMGHRPPLSMKSQEGVKAFVREVNGSIAYIDAKKLDSSVVEIYRWTD